MTYPSTEKLIQHIVKVTGISAQDINNVLVAYTQWVDMSTEEAVYRAGDAMERFLPIETKRDLKDALACGFQAIREKTTAKGLKP